MRLIFPKWLAHDWLMTSNPVAPKCCPKLPPNCHHAKREWNYVTSHTNV